MRLQKRPVLCLCFADTILQIENQRVKLEDFSALLTGSLKIQIIASCCTFRPSNGFDRLS